ncbi:MAG: hypothetical protein FJ312_06820 [SAR202 cluster bacterium]|nr:hypothetical protein [SAR202 cluster bacterium]
MTKLLHALFAVAVAFSVVVALEASHVWTEQAKLTASDGSTSDSFGWSVDADGDTAIVG